MLSENISESCVKFVEVTRFENKRRGVFRPQSNIEDRAFCKKISAVNYFCLI